MDRSYFVKKYSDSTKKFSETDIIKMFVFLIANILAMFDGRVFQRTASISTGISCPQLLAGFFLYSYMANFIQELLK